MRNTIMEESFVVRPDREISVLPKGTNYLRNLFLRMNGSRIPNFEDGSICKKIVE